MVETRTESSGRCTSSIRCGSATSAMSSSAHFARDPKAGKPFAGLRLLDIGCGGGILSEPMARLGAEVVGIDPSATNVEVARLHAEQSGLAIDYRATTAEALVETGETLRCRARHGGGRACRGHRRLHRRGSCVDQARRPASSSPPSTARRRPSRSRSSARNICCAGCRAARTIMPSSSAPPSSRRRSQQPGLRSRADRRPLQPAHRPLVALGRHGRELHDRGRESARRSAPAEPHCLAGRFPPKRRLFPPRICPDVLFAGFGPEMTPASETVAADRWAAFQHAPS